MIRQYVILHLQLVMIPRPRMVYTAGNVEQSGRHHKSEGFILLTVNMSLSCSVYHICLIERSITGSLDR